MVTIAGKGDNPRYTPISETNNGGIVEMMEHIQNINIFKENTN